MKKSKIARYFVFISIFTVFTILIYIIQRSYGNLMKPINTAKSSNLSKPIDPNLDIETLNLIEQKKEYLT